MKKDKRAAIIAGNWKMNKTASEAKELICDLLPLVKDAGCTVIIGVPFTDIAVAVELTKGSNVHVAAQNCHFEDHGAFTGEISPRMLTEAGVEYVILGHSERRQYFAETDETVNKRARAALAAGLKTIICVGESLEQREMDLTMEYVAYQVKAALNGIDASQVRRCVIAYEPIWAIGTGKTATAAQAQEVCEGIRAVIRKIYGARVARTVSILYGGSMNAKNAAELLAQPDIDGGLIGGASLKPADFATIVKATAEE